MIGIVDCGMGNLKSVAHALDFLKADHLFIRNGDAIENVKGLILPGVGAFGEAMRRLQSLNLISPLSKAVIERQVPALGICLGMQIMARSSTEGGLHRGLGWIEGEVNRISVAPKVCLPHVGWNNVSTKKDSRLFANVSTGTHFYFDHTYGLTCQDHYVSATTDYGVPIVAAIEQGHVFATQFHPEKSERNGLRLLRNFINYVEAH